MGDCDWRMRLYHRFCDGWITIMGYTTISLYHRFCDGWITIMGYTTLCLYHRFCDGWITIMGYTLMCLYHRFCDGWITIMGYTMMGLYHRFCDGWLVHWVIRLPYHSKTSTLSLKRNACPVTQGQGHVTPARSYHVTGICKNHLIFLGPVSLHPTKCLLN